MNRKKYCKKVLGKDREEKNNDKGKKYRILMQRKNITE